MDTTTPALVSIGIDIGKDVFLVVGFGAARLPFAARSRARTFNSLVEQRQRLVVGLARPLMKST